jgi:uncharacterized protein YPO0396
LAPLSVSLLVEEGFYPRVAQYANSSTLGGRLTFLMVPDKAVSPIQGRSNTAKSTDSPSAPNGGWLPGKLEFKPGPHAGWLASEVGRRLNLSCVESMDDFFQNTSALTPEGQIKLNDGRHEKDDRAELTDVRSFCLGYDHGRKLAAYDQMMGLLRAELNDLQSEMTDNTAKEKEMENRATECRVVLDLNWEQIDVKSLTDNISFLEERITTLQRKDIKLAEVIKSIAKCTEQKDYLYKNKLICDQKIADNSKKKNSLKDEFDHLISKIQKYTINDQIRTKLNKYFINFGKLALNNIDNITLKVGRQLDNTKNEWQKSKANYEALMVGFLQEFISNWPEDSLDLEPKLSYSAEFINKLEALENDGLPKLQERFDNLLREHSQQNAAVLYKWLNQDLKMIQFRMNMVNDSLANIPFNHVADKPTFLNLRTEVRQLDEVTKFKADLRSVVSDLYVQDQAIKEKRFATIKRLVDDLSSQARDKAVWRDLVLDVRRHVEFSGRELDEEGNEIETYRSGAGKSGGQRQKLAATCLAAALRYQLGGKAYGYPTFGTVVFDEAFDKIDNELTIIALEIFKRLGFQMVLATPMKNIPASEPYIGGAVYVSIADRNKSSLTTLIYDTDNKKIIWPEPPSV